MSDTAMAAVAAAATHAFAKAPALGCATRFRTYKKELKIWLRMTAVPAEKGAPTMMAGLMGVAKRLAGTIAGDNFFRPDGAERLLALVESRVRGTPGTVSVTAFEALHSCERKSRTMAEYLVSVQEAVSLCTEAGLPINDAMQAHLILHQAGLTDPEYTMTVSTAGTGDGAELKFKAVATTLMALFTSRIGASDQSLVSKTAPSPHHLGGNPRPGQDALGGPNGSNKCWYCSKRGHSRADCRLRARHLRERIIQTGSAADNTNVPGRQGNDDDVIHVTVLAGTTGNSWDAPVGQLILDPDATTSVAGSAWVEKALRALPPVEWAVVTRTVTSARLKFDTGEHVVADDQMVLPLRLRSRGFLVRGHVLPGGLPLSLSRPTLTSMEAVVDFGRHTLRAKDLFLSWGISNVGHYTTNALGRVPPVIRPRTLPTAPAILAAAAPTMPAGRRSNPVGRLCAHDLPRG